jgi:hypothetical protein
MAAKAITRGVSARLVDKLDFGRFTRIADIGGGDGTLLAMVLARNPSLRGLPFVLAHVVAGARTNLQGAGVGQRCEVIGGDVFESVPSGCDAYILLKSVLHDWDDDNAARILQRTGEASDTDATLLIVERIAEDETLTATSAMSDLNMMVNTGGQERTLEEWRVLAHVGGFELTGTAEIGDAWHVMEARLS